MQTSDPFLALEMTEARLLKKQEASETPGSLGTQGRKKTLGGAVRAGEGSSVLGRARCMPIFLKMYLFNFILQCIHSSSPTPPPAPPAQPPSTPPNR